MDNIGRYLVSTQLMGNFQSFFLREIGNTAHPCSKSPQRKHRTLARDIGISIEYLFWFTKEDEKVHRFIPHKEALSTNVALSKIAGSWCRSVHKDAIASITEIERNWFVHTIRFRTLRVGDIEIHLLSHLI